jgi:hypothetical protein
MPQAGELFQGTLNGNTGLRISGIVLSAFQISLNNVVRTLGKEGSQLFLLR